jgi:beta-xylosidase
VAGLGDFAALFGRGTSGEGCDAPDLALPGEQAALLEALLDGCAATGTPVVLVLLSGRPYAIGAFTDRLAAVVQAFFPGQEGAAAVAGVLPGRVNPSGRLPMELPAHPGHVVPSYLAAPLGQRSEVSSVDPTPLFAFGHGLSYTSFGWSDVVLDRATIDTGDADQGFRVSLTVTNTGERAGADVVQVYLHDPVASVTRPVTRLVAFARVPRAAGASARVTFGLHTDLTSFTGRDGVRIIEPGALELRVARDAAATGTVLPLTLTGATRPTDAQRVLLADTTVEQA